LNTAIDLRRSMSRKIMRKHVENGTEAYKSWKIWKKNKYEVDDDDAKEEEAES